ncbi:MAG: ArsC family transcriptional regulator [Ruminococcus sp.]|nr:ArsC family transcriptional regulator [Ruminococcus sp.]
MNIQIFGKNKCFDTKKAQRFFKERGIKFQYIDLKQKPMSKGELESVIKAVGGLDKVIDEANKSQTATLIKYLADDEAKKEKLLEDGTLMKTPIVRNGRQAAVGYAPDIWEKWTKE